MNIGLMWSNIYKRWMETPALNDGVVRKEAWSDIAKAAGAAGYSAGWSSCLRFLGIPETRQVPDSLFIEENPVLDKKEVLKLVQGPGASQRYNRNDILRIQMELDPLSSVLYVIVDDPANGCKTHLDGGEPAYELSAGPGSLLCVSQKELEGPALGVFIKGRWKPAEDR